MVQKPRVVAAVYFKERLRQTEDRLIKFLVKYYCLPFLAKDNVRPGAPDIRFQYMKVVQRSNLLEIRKDSTVFMKKTFLKQYAYFLIIVICDL